jgi:hypothetical protein
MCFDEFAFQESDAEREQAFMGWLQGGRLPEIKPGVQQRSARTAYALLESGARLMRERALRCCTPGLISGSRPPCSQPMKACSRSASDS